VKSIEEKTHQYLIVAGSDPASTKLAMELKRELKRLAGTLHRIRLTAPKVDCDTELIAFRQAVTGRDFEVRTREPCGADSTRLFDVSSVADELLNALELRFSAEFIQKAWWRR
jgi:hypothetical protein